MPDNYEIKLCSSYAEVRSVKPTPVVEARFGESGAVVSEHLPSSTTSLGRLSAALNAMPILVFNWAGNGRWNVDAAAGVQRFHGTVTNHSMLKALHERFGFGDDEVKELLQMLKKLAKVKKYPGVPWYR